MHGTRARRAISAGPSCVSRCACAVRLHAQCLHAQCLHVHVHSMCMCTVCAPPCSGPMHLGKSELRVKVRMLVDKGG